MVKVMSHNDGDVARRQDTHGPCERRPDGHLSPTTHVTHATGDAMMTAPRPSGSHLGPACAPACPSLRQAPSRPVRGTQVPGLGERDVRVSVTGRCDGVCGHTHSHNDGTCHMNTGNRNTNGCGVTGKGGHEFETQPESWDCRCACVLHVLPM